MAAALHEESSRMYSWWWDSHISPKNSKWLLENLTDMDAKVKEMIKLIEEDADSFARRAEMYYKKRPELIKLVEEFYRAYRALAERYDHATRELRHAHRTMSKAFPNQVPYVILLDDSTPGSSSLEGEPHTPEMPHPIRTLLDSDDFHKDGLGQSSANLYASKRNGRNSEESESGVSKRGLKQHNGMFGSGGMVPQNSRVAGERIKEGVKVKEEEEKAENEVETLKKALEEIEAEKEAILLQYLQSLLKFSSMKRELNNAQQEAGGLDERASKVDIEVKVFKEALLRLEAERDAELLQYNRCLERIATLETMIAEAQEDSKRTNEQASKAEIEVQNLRQELLRLETEKEAALLQYRQCLEMIDALESKILLAEENARMLDEQTERAETEIKALKEALARLNEEKKAIAFQYEQCLEKIAQMESEIFSAHEDVKRLNSEILMGAEKLRTSEQQCVLLERSNQSLQAEAESLVQKIAMKDQELSQKQKELEKLHSSLLDEHSRFVEVEVTLQTLQMLHSQSQEEQKALTLELQNKLQTLKNLEVCNHDLEEDIKQVKSENHNLIELNNSSIISTENLQNEFFNLKEIKEKLEKEIALQEDKSNALQLDVHCLKEEIKDLSKRYQALVEQVLSAGLNPEHFESSVKELKEENSKLKEVWKKQADEKEVLQEKLKDVDNLLKKNAGLESSLSEMNIKFEWSGERMKDLQESCQFLREDKSTIVSEKATLLSQLQMMTENMQKLLEKNFTLEISLASANVELEGLRAKTKILEEFWQLQKSEISNLQSERSTLVSQLENVEKKLGDLEKRLAKLEEKYADMEKAKESTLSQVENLWVSLNTEQLERAYYVKSSESRMEDLESLVHLLQEETRLRKKEFEEELDKAVKAQVEIFILQKFVKDLEEKNLSLLIQSQKHTEASKLSNKLIAELEIENLEQLVETELLLEEFERLRTGIYQVFRVLQFDPVNLNEHKIAQGQIPIPRILEDIENLKSSVVRSEDEKQQLLVQNSVLLSLIRQLGLEGAKQDSEKKIFEQELMIMMEKCLMLQKDKDKLLEMNKQLMLEVTDGEQQEDALKDELETQGLKLASLQEAYLTLQEENSKLLEEGRLLLKRFSALKEEMSVLEEENNVILQEALDNGNISTVFKSFGVEKAEEIKALAEDLNVVHMFNGELKEKVELLGKKLEMKEAESQHLNETVDKLQKELKEVKDLNDQLNIQIFIGEDSPRQNFSELLEAEQKLEALYTLNANLSITVEDLKRECKELKRVKHNAEKQILEISRDCAKQEKELECLQEVNRSLEHEVGMLGDEIEEQMIREVVLSSELEERSNEFELWEAEASSFYFDLQNSSTREVFLESKVHELTEVCKSLEDESATKSSEIKQMKERVGFLETEIGRLKSHFSSYDTVIASLGDDIASLEFNVLCRKKHFPAGNREQKSSEMADQLRQIDSPEPEVKSIAETDAFSELREMQTRIKAVEKAFVEEIERRAVEESMKFSTSHQGKGVQRQEIEPEEGKFTAKSKPETAEVRNRSLTKDITLDSHREKAGAYNRMLGLQKRAEQAGTPVANISVHGQPNAVESKNPSSRLEVEKELSVDKLEVSSSKRETNKEGNKRKILERLASDAQKLISLQTTVQELKMKMEMDKRSKKANDPEYEIVKNQLEEVEENVIELVGINDQLTRDTEESPSCDGKSSAEMEEAGRNKVTKLAQKGSDKIGRLQLEVQIINYILQKLEVENKTKAKYKFSESKTGVLLRDFITSSGRSSGGRRKKGSLCRCMRRPTNGD